jgi:methyl-accepting chemotaxis protein
MGLRGKIIAICSGLLILLGVAMLGAYYVSTEERIVQQYVEKARSVVLTTESAREEMGRKWEQGIFTAETVAQWGHEGRQDKVLASVPVVTAWNAAMAKSKEGGYEFKVPKFDPRNPKNLPDAVEAEVLHMFEKDANLTEHYVLDAKAHKIRYFRPIRLTQECLLCHGDPKTSQELWGNSDGLDITGGPMENWKVGEVHGAFEVVQSLEPAEAQMAVAMWEGAGLIVGLVILSGGVVAWLITRLVSRPTSRIVQTLTSGSDQVAAASGQISSASQNNVVQALESLVSGAPAHVTTADAPDQQSVPSIAGRIGPASHARRNAA